MRICSQIRLHVLKEIKGPELPPLHHAIELPPLEKFSRASHGLSPPSAQPTELRFFENKLPNTLVGESYYLC